jgi:hypothetical protein
VDRLPKFIAFLFRGGNWKFAFMITIFMILLPTFAYKMATMDPDLYYEDRFSKLQGQLWAEMRGLPLPQKTAINREDSFSKYQVGINIMTRYRTELSADEFVSQFNSTLVSDGWALYVPSRADINTEYLCRRKLRASIIHEGVSWFANDHKGDYWKLEFFYSPDSDNLSSPFPVGCTRN